MTDRNVNQLDVSDFKDINHINHINHINRFPGLILTFCGEGMFQRR